MEASKVTNPDCESCGGNDWQIVEGAGPVIEITREHGRYALPPGRIATTPMICRHCRFVRLYAEPQG